MSEEQGFLAHLAAHPGDDVTRAVYADWLEERGDGRSVYLRQEMELAMISEYDERYIPLEENLRATREGIDPDWLARASKRFDVVLYNYQPSRKISLIKVIREKNSGGLKELKDQVELLPSCLAAALPRLQAEALRDQCKSSLPDGGLELELVPTEYFAPAYAASYSTYYHETYPVTPDEISKQSNVLAQIATLTGISVEGLGGPPHTPVRLLEGVPFTQADAVRQAGLPGARIILSRLPIMPDLPPGVDRSRWYQSGHSLILDAVDSRKTAFVAGVLSRLWNCSVEDAEVRLGMLPVTVGEDMTGADGVYLFRRFRGWATIRVVRDQ